MKLRDLQDHVYEKVCVYILKDEERIEFEDIPDKLLECEIDLIGAGETGCLYISIKYVTSIN